MSLSRTALLFCVCVACAGSPEPASSDPAGPSKGSRSEPAPAPERYGGELDPAVPFVALSTLLDEPATMLGKSVRTAGRVERVCTRRGCWLELTADGRSPLRVPMAGHAFFVPQSLVGREAEIQGTLTATPLPEAHRTHVAAEGATALGPLSLHATAVQASPD